MCRYHWEGVRREKEIVTVEEAEDRLIRERSPGWRWGMQPEPCLPLPLERKGVVAGTQKR